MALYEQFPYTNFHEMNLDWIVKAMLEALKDYEKLSEDTKEQIAELEDIINNEIVQYIQQYVDDHLAQFVLTASYDEPTRTIVMNV